MIDRLVMVYVWRVPAHKPNLQQRKARVIGREGIEKDRSSLKCAQGVRGNRECYCCQEYFLIKSEKATDPVTRLTRIRV